MTKKSWTYILVLTNSGPVFVTGFINHNTAEWDKLKKPISLSSKKYAEEVAYGLRLNGYDAFVTTLPYELGNQPYIYDKGHFEWVWSEEAKATGQYANQEE